MVDGLAPLVAHALGHVDFAQTALVEEPGHCLGAWVAAVIGAVLDQDRVFSGRLDQFTAFEEVMAAGFFDRDMFTRLQRPDRCERVPVVGRDERHSVDLRIL